MSRFARSGDTSEASSEGQSGAPAATGPHADFGPPAVTAEGRAATDEVAADRARAWYGANEMAPVEPDARIAPLLGPGEHVLAVRRSVVFDRRLPADSRPAPTGSGTSSRDQPTTGASITRPAPTVGAPSARHVPSGVAASLYLTTRRLVLIGRVTVSLDLDDIEEAVVSGERLVLLTADRRSLALGVDQPRLLRVEIAAARRYARGRSGAGLAPGADASGSR